MQQKSTKHFVSFTPISFLFFRKTPYKETKKGQAKHIKYVTYAPYISLNIYLCVLKQFLKDCNTETHKAWENTFKTKKQHNKQVIKRWHQIEN